MGSRDPRRDRSFVVYVWSKGTHSCIHSFVYFLRREGGGFPSRMLTRWVSVKDDQGGTSNSRSFLWIWSTVSLTRLAVVGHLRNIWVSTKWIYFPWQFWAPAIISCGRTVPGAQSAPGAREDLKFKV